MGTKVHDIFMLGSSMNIISESSKGDDDSKVTW